MGEERLTGEEGDLASDRRQYKKSLLKDRKALQAQIVECFRRIDPERIILFGSAARGEADTFSDIDVIIVQRTTKRFLDRLEEAYMCWTLPFGVDMLVYTPEEFQSMVEQENPFLTEALTHGRMIYERPGR